MPAALGLRLHTFSLTPDEVARRHEQSLKRALYSSGKGGSVPEETPSKRQRADASPPIVAEKVVLVSDDAAASVRCSAPGSIFPPTGGLLRGEAYTLTRSKDSKLILHLNQLTGDYDEDVHARENELRETREANIALQSKLDELVERNKIFEDDATSAKRDKRVLETRSRELETRLMEIELEHAKDREEIDLTKRQLDFAYDN